MKYGNSGFDWDNTITCDSCGMKKHIAINEGFDDGDDRWNLLQFEQSKAKCCKNPDYWMYPPKYAAKEKFEHAK